MASDDCQIESKWCAFSFRRRRSQRRLAGYAERFGDPHADQPAIRAALAWAAGGAGAYVVPPRPRRMGKGKKGRGEDDSM
jgi:hypothetical protein